MRRRTFISLAAGATTARVPTLAAQQNPRIGFIGFGAQQSNQHLLAALREGFHALGWSDDSITILDRWADEHGERLGGIASELVSSGADILVTAGTLATLAATRQKTSVPIIFVGVGDPLALGLVTDLAHPGGNATGFSLHSTASVNQRLSLLRELLPDFHRVGVIARNERGLQQNLQDIRSSARRLGIELVEFEATTGQALRLAFMHLQSDRCDAIYVASGPLGPAKRALLIALAERARLPAIYSFRIFAVNRGLMSYAVDDRDLFRRAATYVDRVLKGAIPADLPVEQPTKFELVINLKTAKALELTSPPSLLLRADQVIE